MGPIAMTRKTCDQERMRIERTYLGILHSGPVWDIAGSSLVVKSPFGTLNFKRGL
jgi:heat shock protein HslJ